MRSQGWLLMGAVLATCLLVGCDKTFTICIRNTSPVARELEMSDPNGFHPLGVLPPGKARNYTIKLPKSDLPANFELMAGPLKKPFTLDAKDRNEQFIYIEENSIVGPIDHNTEVRTSSKYSGRSSSTGQPAVNNNAPTGNAPTPPPPANDNGGGRMIEQKEVVE